jgi:exonuclease VII small subunit
MYIMPYIALMVNVKALYVVHCTLDQSVILFANGIHLARKGERAARAAEFIS